ncbi:MAG TPA: hypothetical protein VIY27_08070 [Myxococcota bacterium]
MKTLKWLNIVAPSLLAVTIVAAQLAIPDPAEATDALFRMKRSWHGNGTNTSQFYNPKKPDFSTAYVGDTTPAQRVVIPEAVIFFTGYGSFCGPNPPCFPGYPTSYQYWSYWNYPGFFYPNNPWAATTTTTAMGVTTTTRWGGNYAFSRAGTITIDPGPNRFGGTMRYFWGPNRTNWNFITNVSPCCMTGTGHMYRTPYGGNNVTSMQTQKIGATYQGWVGYRRHTYLTTGGTAMNPYTNRVKYFYTTAPWTTGQLQFYQPLGSYLSRATVTGSDTRTPLGLEGKLSLVVPWLTQMYLWGPSKPITAAWHSGSINRNIIQFFGEAPEPGQMLMLGVGITLLAGLVRLRRR